MKRYYLLVVVSLFMAPLLGQQVLNDECGTATFLGTVTDFCTEIRELSNVGATPSPEARPFCWADVGNDVWYSFIPTQPAAIITVTGATQAGDGGLEDPSFALYEGTCSSLNEIACEERQVGIDVFEQFVDNLIIGQIYYIRMDGRLGTTGGFQICINTFIPVPDPDSDCPTGVVLCDKTPFFVEGLEGVGLMEELNGTPNVCFSGNPAFFGESSSAWYRWTCLDPGSLTFTITPNNNPTNAVSDDLDFLLFRLPGGLEDCNSRELVRCMLSGANSGEPFEAWMACNGPTGLMIGDGDTEEFNGCQDGNNNFVEAINMVAGESYALVIMNFSETGQGFSIEFGGTGTFVGPEPDFEATLPTAEQVFECDKTILFEDLSESATDPIVEWFWSFGVGADIPVAVGPGPHTIIYESFGPKTVALTVTSSRGCQVTQILDLDVEPCCADISTLDLAVQPFDILCAGELSGELAAQGIGGDPEYQFSINGNPFLPNTQYNGLPAGEYTITVQDIKGCEETTTVTIEEADPIIITTSENVEIDLGLTTDIFADAEGGTGNLTFMWTPCNENISCCDCPNPEVFPSDVQNVYTVMITDENGCTETRNIVVTTNLDPLFFAPNIFSPNGDGNNEFFNGFAGNGSNPTYHLSVYDRYGNLLFDDPALPHSDIGIGWNGRFGNDPATEGVYTWLARVGFINGDVFNFTGDVTIVR